MEPAVLPPRLAGVDPPRPIPLVARWVGRTRRLLHDGGHRVDERGEMRAPAMPAEPLVDRTREPLGDRDADELLEPRQRIRADSIGVRLHPAEDVRDDEIGIAHAKT